MQPVKPHCRFENVGQREQMTELPILGAILFASVLGVRHGLDWDHLTAIADLVGVAGPRPPRALGVGLWLCLGPRAVIPALGVLVAVPPPPPPPSLFLFPY